MSGIGERPKKPSYDWRGDGPSRTDPWPRHRKRSPGAAASSRRLLPYHELPEWYRDNQFIHHGYRPVSHSIRACLASWRYLHNETFNIYSHLVPALLFLLAAGAFNRSLQARYPDATGSDHAVFAFFLLTAVIALGMSATYHTLINHSHRVCDLSLRFDLIGIVIRTLGDFVSGIYMGFYCESTLKRTYWAMLNHRFQGRRWRTLRACVFVATGLSGFAPLIHGIVLFGFPQTMKRSGMPCYLGEGLLLILGAILYTTRIPESLWPGRFDLFGSSHQIFHITVVLGTTIHLMGILSAFDYHYRQGTCRLS
ncbi:hemolysin-III channel protein Izh2 [Aspergillus ellipticus CBS 707.79]|uniref:Hemolysin-III channel protein Izh2 n=1 Tax=Aspergillus ellipticus CBS 707.79 TaxID=1448320 RepID=A0A319DAC8_9EURO|nr:hemolysin-III channel protein Izh2 [Aspergillus ellipticus CBS 707.79]